MPEHRSAEPISGILDHARNLHAEGNTFEAIAYLENSPHFNESDRILAQLAHYHYLVRHYDIASSTAIRALELNPRNAFALFTLGEVAMKARDFDRAEMYFRDALAAGSRSVYPYLRLASIATESHHYDRAVDVLHEGLAVHTGHPDLLENLHFALTMAGRHKEADHVRKTRRVQDENDSGDIRRLLNRFEVLERSKAIEQLRILLSMTHYRKEALIHDQLARYLMAESRYAEAVPHLEVVVEMQPRNDRVRLQLAEALALSGNTEKASVLLDSMARYRDDLQLKMVRTEILIASGKVQEAMDLCVELLKHSPRNKRLRRMLQNLRRKGIRPNR